MARSSWRGGRSAAWFGAFFDGELTWLCVDPLAHRCGVGRALLRHIIDACAEELVTEVLVGNEPVLRPSSNAPVPEARVFSDTAHEFKYPGRPAR
jgi:GNAT superfamily N-acetyltransferase